MKTKIKMINYKAFERMTSTLDCISIMLYLNDHNQIELNSPNLKEITKNHLDLKTNINCLVELNYIKTKGKAKVYYITDHGKFITKRMISICSKPKAIK